MIDPPPPPQFYTSSGNNENLLSELFALTAADYLDQHAPDWLARCEKLVESSRAVTVEDLSYEYFAHLISKPDYSVIAAATRGIMNIYMKQSWGDKYCNMPVDVSSTFHGSVLLFLCEHGLNFYEVFSGNPLT